MNKINQKLAEKDWKLKKHKTIYAEKMERMARMPGDGMPVYRDPMIESGVAYTTNIPIKKLKK